MAIKHNVYFKGSVQSLGFACRLDGAPGGYVDCTVGVLEPGDYEFEASRFECITVIIGELWDKRDESDTYNGMMNRFGGMGRNRLPEFKPGEKVRLHCSKVVVYVCYYSNASFGA